MIRLYSSDSAASIVLDNKRLRGFTKIESLLYFASRAFISLISYISD